MQGTWCDFLKKLNNIPVNYFVKNMVVDETGAREHLWSRARCAAARRPPQPPAGTPPRPGVSEARSELGWAALGRGLHKATIDRKK